jgi:signal transduction histidine kinase/CheY-like chemotaxis protein
MALGVALAVWCGWWFKSPLLVQLGYELAPMQFNTALGFVLLSLALLLSRTPRGPWAAGACAGLALGLATVSLLQYPLHTDFGLDTFFLKPFVTARTSHPGRMAPNTAMAFIGSTMALLLLLSTSNAGLLFLGGAAALGSLTLAVAGLCGYAFHLETMYRWSTFTHMAMHTALLHTLLAYVILTRITTQLRRQLESHILIQTVSVLGVGGVVSLLLFLSAQTQGARQTHAILEREVQLRQAFLQHSVEVNLQLLRSAERLFASSSFVDRDEFRTFVMPFLQHDNAIVAFDWAPRVIPETRAAFEHDLQPFTPNGIRRIASVAPSGLLSPHPGAQVYYPVQYVVPEEYNHAVLGVDHYSDPLRVMAMYEAARTGEPFRTELFRLFRLSEERGDREDFLVFVPSYLDGKPAHAVLSAADSQIRGFVIGVFRLSRLINQALASFPQREFHLAVYPETSLARIHAASPAVVLYDGPAEPMPTTTQMRLSTTLQIAGQGLRLIFWPTSSFLKRQTSSQPQLILTVALVTTLLAAGYVYFVRRKQLQERILMRTLSETRDQALQATQAKSDFLASISHEIRTPMNAILGMADLLNDTALTLEQQDYVQRFRKAGEHLLTLINDILDLSKIEAGHLELEHTPFDLEELVQAVGELMAARAQGKGLELLITIAPDVPTHLIGDPMRLRQILLNLLGNAIKFTATGDVILRVAYDLTASHPGRLRFTVQDTGIGIPAEKLGTIFESFTQVDASTTRQYGGTGLGLSISRRLVHLMGGELSVTSQVGVGSIFAFTVQCEINLAPQWQVTALALQCQGWRALIIDDNATNRLILRETLEHRSMVVTEASGAEDGLAAWQAAQHDRLPFEVMLVDCQMPGKDGFYFIEQVRRLQPADPGLICMLSSDNRPGDRARCQELGVSSYLLKPITRGALWRALAEARSQHLATPAPTASTAPPVDQERGLRILVAEDNEDNQMLIQSYLKRTPHQLTLAENGAVAVEYFQTGSYDLVFMDVQMPVMDGYEATTRIRQWEQTQQRPPTRIVALTANALTEDTQKSLDAGCNGHLTKPIKKAALLHAITEYSSDLTHTA